MKMKKTNLRALTEGAIMVALAQVLGYIKLFDLPQGGSVCLGMLPVFICCARWGFGPGILASFAFSLLQLLLDGGYAWGWQAILGDYIIAYSVLGLAGLFSRMRNGFFLGTALGCLLRFAAHLVTGATIWAEYMPESFFGMTMTNPWIYSALYNGSYIGADALLILAVGLLLWKPLGSYIRGEDLKD